MKKKMDADAYTSSWVTLPVPGSVQHHQGHKKLVPPQHSLHKNMMCVVFLLFPSPSLPSSPLLPPLPFFFAFFIAVSFGLMLSQPPPSHPTDKH
jgi:hypothetical protein